jgi:hypothetical protein
MKNSIKGLVVISVIVMSLVAVQSVSADIVTGTIVTGTITDISTNNPSNMIVVNDDTGETTSYEVYGMRIKWLEKQYDIVLEDLMNNKMEVTIDAYPVECTDGTIKLMACRITVFDGDTADLRLCPPNNPTQ